MKAAAILVGFIDIKILLIGKSMLISWSKIAKHFSGRPLKLELVLEMYRKVG